MSRSYSLPFVLLLAIGLLGCDTTATQPESQVVVQAYLQAEAPMPPLRLTRTVGASDAYDPRDNAVRGASVAVDKLGPDEAVVETISYAETDSVPGLYAPTAAALVEPQTTYRLRVQTRDGTTITSTTAVPDSIPLVNVENQTTVYQSDAQPAFTIEPPRRRADRQNVYTFTVTSTLPRDSLQANFTPFYADQYDADEDSLASFRTTSSGLLNQGNFSENPDGTITVDLPWLGVAFYGANEVAINAVDDNLYDFLRSQSAQQGAFAPGEIPNVIEHVEGGTGIFGSYAQAVQPVVIQRPQQP